MFKKPDFILLLVVNLITLYFAIYNQISFGNVIHIYWFQTIIILILAIPKYVITALLAPYKAEYDSGETMPSKIFRTENIVLVLGFIIIEVFMFALMFTYNWLLTGLGYINVSNINTAMIISVSAFFINHLISLVIYWGQLVPKHSVTSTQNDVFDYLGEIIQSIFRRVMPIHIIIVLSAFLMVFKDLGKAQIIAFVLIKIIFDIFSHYKEHKTSN